MRLDIPVSARWEQGWIEDRPPVSRALLAHWVVQSLSFAVSVFVLLANPNDNVISPGDLVEMYVHASHPHFPSFFHP